MIPILIIEADTSGIGFLSVLTATIASYFVKTERGSETGEILERLKRIEQALLDLGAGGAEGG